MFSAPVPSSGPTPAKILILAEAPGEREVEAGQPLVGPSGWELRRMLATIGANLDDCRKVNVFSRRPDDNNLSLFGVPDGSEEARSLGPLTRNPILFVNDKWLPEVARVHREIATCNPNVVIALGNTACWALGLGIGINNLRGSLYTVSIPGLSRPLKVLPTFHPAAVLRNWSERVIALADLEKAYVEARTPEATFDNTELWLQPSLDDLRRFDVDHMRAATVCATDVETKRGQITCVSFCPTPSVSLAIPFWVEGQQPHYWSSVEDEVAAWGYVRRWVERPDLTKVMQNGLYDLQYFLRHGISPRACTEDTMLAHHSLYSELRKGLGFLGSIYCNVPSWKKMRTFRKEEDLKRDA